MSANVSMASLPVAFVCPEPVLANHCVFYIPVRNYCNTKPNRHFCFTTHSPGVVDAGRLAVRSGAINRMAVRMQHRPAPLVAISSVDRRRHPQRMVVLHLERR